MNLEKQNSWIHKDKQFSVEVKCWWTGERFVWNVYAYIYESHPIFTDKEKAKELPFHGGCTYDALLTTEPLEGIMFDWQKINKTVKVGCDYGHLYDSYYEQFSPENGIPRNIEKDVEKLIEALTIKEAA